MNSILPIIDTEQESDRIVRFIRNVFYDQGIGKAIVAMSGGIDSAVSLVLLVKALGEENVYSLSMPSRQTRQIDMEDAQRVLEQAHIPRSNQFRIPINSIVQKSWRVIKKNVRPTKANTSENRLRLGNLMARIRMVVLYDQAKLLNAMVVGTGNRSEYLLGYYTRFGDEASDIEPIQHLFKTQVFGLAKFLNITDQVIKKAPTAGLWSGQTDEKDMGFNYEIADQVLHLYFDKHYTTDIIEKELSKYDTETVEKILNMVTKNSFKLHVPYKIKDRS